MDIRRTLVCALALALVAGFVGKAGAAEEVAEEEAVNDETPYIDEDGNFDAAMAKEYAEQVDSYVDEFGIAWDVWLDEFGGQMWAETTNPKALELGAVESVSLSDETTSEGQPITLLINYFVPNWVKVWRNGLSPSTVMYTLAGNDDGQIIFWEGCGTGCAKWRLFVSPSGQAPANVTQIQGRALSNMNVCSGYEGYYSPGDGTWHDADSTSCFYSIPDSSYAYITTGWEEFSVGGDDYASGDLMVRWNYTSGGSTQSFKVYYGGIIPG